MNTEKELEDVRIEKPSWRRWPIVFLFSLYGCHYSFQVSFVNKFILDVVQVYFKWLMYLSCATVITEYYNVSMNIVTWTGTIALGRVFNHNF